MFTQAILGALALALVAGRLARSIARTSRTRKSLQVLNDVAAQVRQYTRFTIFDDVNVAMENGVVTLSGRVTMPFKKDDIGARVATVDGVSQVKNDLTVLPVSPFDDELRYRIARAIYSNPVVLELRRDGLPADPHRRGERARDAHRHREQQRRAYAGAVAGHHLRRVLGHERLENRRRGAGARSSTSASRCRGPKDVKLTSLQVSPSAACGAASRAAGAHPIGPSAPQLCRPLVNPVRVVPVRGLSEVRRHAPLDPRPRTRAVGCSEASRTPWITGDRRPDRSEP